MAELATMYPSSLPPGKRKRRTFLVEFAHKHVNFQLAELTSVLDMNGILDDCVVEPLPNQENERLTALHEYTRKQWIPSKEGNRDERYRSFLILSFPFHLTGDLASQAGNDVEQVVSALSQCVLVKGVVELWGKGRDLNDCADDVRCLMPSGVSGTDDISSVCTESDGCPNLIRRHCIVGAKSWKMTVHTFGSKYSREEQNEMRSNFSFLPFTGSVVMKDPDEEFVVIREVEVDELGNPRFPRHSHKRLLIPENDERPPLAVYFGRVLGGGRNFREGRDEKYGLKRRPYLGPTSMDSELSMIMTNLAQRNVIIVFVDREEAKLATMWRRGTFSYNAEGSAVEKPENCHVFALDIRSFLQVKKRSFCFDPFVGTASILLTCALKGAYCLGTDIDIRVLKGKGVNENILSNFKKFDLARPELVRSDNSIYTKHFRPHDAIFDVIICDPPYGIRAGARKSGSKSEDVRPVTDEHRHDHIAQTQPYSVADVMAHLLDVAARTLVLHGRLVYIIPSMTDFDQNVDLPRHPCLKLVHCCYQPLQMNLGRRIVALEKMTEYDESQHEVYQAGVWANGPASAEKCANIRERLLEEARKKPGYKEKAALRSKKRKARKEELKKEKLAARSEQSKA